METLSQKLAVRKAGRGGGGGGGAGPSSAATSAARVDSNEAPFNGRGTGGGTGPNGAAVVERQAVQETNLDAQHAKLSAVSLGYVEDPFVAHFVNTPSRRPPLINRGYYARHYLLEALIRAFVTAVDGPTQLLLLGAGFDTRVFRYRRQGAPYDRTTVFEVDFPRVTAAKVTTILATPALHSLWTDPIVAGDDGTSLAAERYRIVGGDLSQLDDVVTRLQAAGLDPSVPTLVLSECVLIYLHTTDADAVVRWAATFFTRSMFLCYEQIRPHDAFGQVMLQNLSARGIQLHSIHEYPTVEAQVDRYLRLGYTHPTAVDMMTAYTRYIPPEEQQRVARLELFDEMEEWHLIMQHYCLAWAATDADLGRVRLPEHATAGPRPPAAARFID